jgi:uncharacterized protein YggE
MKQKLIIIGIAVLALLLSSCGTAVEQASQPIESTISVNGSGTASAIPDVVDIQLGVDILDVDPVEAVAQNTSKMDAVMTVLDDMNVLETDIQTIYYSMWVEDVYDQEGQLTGEKRYRVTNQVNVRLRDLTQVGTLIAKATDAGATSISGITFGVADTTELEQTALESALGAAHDKAVKIADEMDLSIGEIVNINESGFYSPPTPFYGEKGIGGGTGAVPISQGQFSVTTSVQIIYNLVHIP